MFTFPATIRGLLILGFVARIMGNYSNQAFADEKYQDEFDPYIARGGLPMSAEEKESCNNLNLLVLNAVYFGSLPMRWRAAHECCKLKGLALLSQPRRHTAALRQLKIQWEPDYTSFPWVGTNDILEETQYEWVSGELIPLRIPPWMPGEPDNLEGNENCGMTDRQGLMNDYSCDHLTPFLCEDLPPRGGKEPTPDELKICDSIVFEETPNGFRKQNNISPKTSANWPLAMECCRAKGWELASLQDLSTQDEALLSNLLGEGNLPFWTSGSNIQNEEFVWGSRSDVISRDFRLWDINSPQGLFHNRHCVQVRRSSQTGVEMRDVSCNIKLGILCQAESSCKATDTATLITKPGTNQFKFQPAATSATELEIGLSLERHLSPSRVTSLHWSIIWRTFYSETGGITPIAFSPSALEPPNQLDKCITTFHAWIEYVATCKDTNVVYVAPEVVTAENVTTLCPTTTTCVESPCKACDRWVLIATHKNKELTLDEKSSDRSGIENMDQELKPCFEFKPPTDSNDFLNALLYSEFITKLNPSPSTGVNWAQYYQNVSAGIPANGYKVGGKDVPPGTFLNVYRVLGTCGTHTTTIKVYKLVLFSVENILGNCYLAKSENVPLKGCESQ